MPEQESVPEAEWSRAVGCSREAGGQIMLQQGQRTLRLTAQCPRWTLQDQCHHILRTFTLFKDKCIVNFVSPNTRYACRFTPPAAKGGLTSTRCKTLYKWNQMSFSMVQNYLNLQSTAVLLDFRLKCRGCGEREQWLYEAWAWPFRMQGSCSNKTPGYNFWTQKKCPPAQFTSGSARILHVVDNYL